MKFVLLCQKSGNKQKYNFEKIEALNESIIEMASIHAITGTTSFPQSSFVRPSVPRLNTNTEHGIDIYNFPDLCPFPDHKVPRP